MLISNEKSLSISRQWGLLPVELFETKEKKYLLDINQVNFLEVDEIVFKIASLISKSKKSLEEIASELKEYSVQEIQDALEVIDEYQNQGYLINQEFTRENPFTNSDIKETIENKLMGLYMNVTSSCNLSCGYCIFGSNYDNHGKLVNKNMTTEVADKAIQFFLKRARKDDFLRVDFFGGEPLLAFPLIKKVVLDLKKQLKERNQELIISIASNGTILTDEILDFFIEHNVCYQISIDGDKEIHDLKRKFKSNKEGSFDTILANLQKVYDRNLDYFKTNMRLKAVVTTEGLDNDGKSFFTQPLIALLEKEKRFTMVNKQPYFDIRKDQDFFERLHKLGKTLLQKKGVSSIEELISGLSYMKRYFFYMTFFEFFKMQVANNLFYGNLLTVPYMKDCMIGIEGCVNIDGSISICYKSDSFIIGNVVEDTWYHDRIEMYHQRRYEWPNCKNCYTQRFCKLCYEQINGREEFMRDSIHTYCEFNRQFYRIIVQYMLEVTENNPGLWDELQNIADNHKESLIQKNRARHQ